MLATEELVEPRPVTGDVDVRPLTTDDDWAQSAALRLALDSADSAAHRAFVENKVDEARRMAADGTAAYWGAFSAGSLRSSLGVVGDGYGLGRYQSVETHPDFRNRGFAGRVVYDAGRDAADRLGARRLVIAADPDYVAIRLYRRLGFHDVEPQVQLLRAPDA